MNAPDRFELFLLQDGEKKIKEEIYPSMANASQFTIMKEDHTLAGPLCAYLRKNPHVRFAAYKMPHPNVPEMLVRVQTDGEITPKEAVLQTCKKIMVMLTTLRNNFTREFELRRMADSGDPNANGNGDNQAGHGAGGLGGPGGNRGF